MKSWFNKRCTRKNILLLSVWGAVIATGFLALGAVAGGMESLAVFGGIHRIAVRVALIATVIYVLYRSRKQINAYFGTVEQRRTINRAVKITSAVVLHILLHMVSIHLAILFVFIHIYQHRNGFVSVFKRVQFLKDSFLAQRTTLRIVT